MSSGGGLIGMPKPESLTLGALQAAVVSHGAEELKDEDGDSHH